MIWICLNKGHLQWPKGNTMGNPSRTLNQHFHPSRKKDLHIEFESRAPLSLWDILAPRQLPVAAAVRTSSGAPWHMLPSCVFWLPQAQIIKDDQRLFPIHVWQRRYLTSLEGLWAAFSVHIFRPILWGTVEMRIVQLVHFLCAQIESWDLIWPWTSNEKTRKDGILPQLIVPDDVACKVSIWYSNWLQATLR